MEKITVKGRIEFRDRKLKGYNREFTATLQDSAAFAYGNKTSVYIEYGTMDNGERAEPTLIDTRYDRTIRSNEASFKEWIRVYIKEHFAPHTLTIY